MSVRLAIPSEASPVGESLSMVNLLLLPEIRQMIAERDEIGLAELMSVLHPASIAEFAEGLADEEVWQLLQRGSIQRQAEVFPFFSPEKEQSLLQGLGRENMSRLLEAMSHDDRVALLKRCDTTTVDNLLPLLAKADREDIRRLLTYPARTAGAVMTTDYATLPPEITVEEALQQLRQQAPDKETIYYVYVIDEDRHLIGFVSLRELLVARPTDVIRQIMRADVIRVPADQDQESVARQLSRYNFLAMPVVDEQNRIVGIITYDDVIDVLEEAATEDALHMGAVATFEDHYLNAPFTTVWRKRAMWLSCLFIAELFTFTALSRYEDAISAVIALSLFVPLCISTGGNSGSQAATLITRAMALGQITPSQWFLILRHELAMGLALGGTLGVIGFFRASLTPQSVLGTANRWMLAAVIGQSVAVICLWGTIVGSMLPLVFRRLGFDPGYASSPFVATFVDVTGIVIYFSIAKIWLLH